MEQFAIRFKTADTASDFHTAFNAGVNSASDQPGEQKLLPAPSTVVTPQPISSPFTPRPVATAQFTSKIPVSSPFTPQPSGSPFTPTPVTSSTPTDTPSTSTPVKTTPEPRKPSGRFDFQFGASSKPVQKTSNPFEFKFNPSTPEVIKPTPEAAAVDEPAENGEPEVHFEPVVQLDEIEVKSGEEEEEIKFENRAKLYRYDKEWKERGLGYIKILQHKETHKTRILMRREQVMKICANHLIQPEMNLTVMDGKVRFFEIDLVFRLPIFTLPFENILFTMAISAKVLIVKN